MIMDGTFGVCTMDQQIGTKYGDGSRGRVRVRGFGGLGRREGTAGSNWTSKGWGPKAVPTDS
jgi:hypothetical protein